MVRQLSRFKATLHPWIDPVVSLPDHWLAQRQLAGLEKGRYRVKVDVPYYAQFASREHIYDYIHHGFDGTQDPQWHTFGTHSPAEYVFWAPRVCALACLKMAVEAFSAAEQPSLWQLVKEGLEVNGYTVRDKSGNWVDEGWYYHAQVHLAQHHGLQALGRAYVSPLRVCQYIREGWLVAASVTPEIGEHEPAIERYGGHGVLVYGFDWDNGCPTHYHLHNPSGRFHDLQAHAQIPAARFRACFAYRLIALRPSS